MNRWRKALIAASVGVAASAAFVVTSSIPGQAAASLVANYRCIGGIAGAGVDLEARMTPQIESGTMNVRWDMSYESLQKFGSPGFFPEGSLLNLEGVVDISGAWIGQLRPRGGEEQGELLPGSYLELPEGLSDSASLTRSGTIRFKPSALTVRFTPAEGEVLVNNHKPSITYSGLWDRLHTEEEYADHLNDVHKSSALDARAKLAFKGTKVAYIARRAPDLGPIRVILDGQTVTEGLIEPSKDRSGNAMTGTQSQEVLWESPQLDYEPHTVEIISVEAKDAYVDAFRVTVSDVPEPPAHDQAVCTLQGDPGAIDITVPGPTTTPTDDPTDDPPTDDPTEDPTSTSTATTTAPNGNTTTIGQGHVIVVPQASNSSSATPKTTGPTATKYYKPQVAKTPKGGVDSGEAPDGGDQPYGLMASGMALTVGSVGSGLLLRRRRAAHAGGVK
ncbi:hypothetical protein [Nonomuraea basaltis]|uniref:hypothetical protein n=1 Tax=Nonomuraea basaltis TaxID=2495887 RepID=UPI00110C70A2|nr:hypothetical protein [Nonomuraea basaltis]TMR95653.1 hypothetical protein EJK15_27635 [Nonomuraea basaltis]